MICWSSPFHDQKLKFFLTKPQYITNILWKFEDFLPSRLGVIKVNIYQLELKNYRIKELKAQENILFAVFGKTTLIRRGSQVWNVRFCLKWLGSLLPSFSDEDSAMSALLIYTVNKQKILSTTQNHLAVVWTDGGLFYHWA